MTMLELINGFLPELTSPRFPSGWVDFCHGKPLLLLVFASSAIPVGSPGSFLGGIQKNRLCLQGAIAALIAISMALEESRRGSICTFSWLKRLLCTLNIVDCPLPRPALSTFVFLPFSPVLELAHVW